MSSRWDLPVDGRVAVGVSVRVALDGSRDTSKLAGRGGASARFGMATGRRGA